MKAVAVGVVKFFVKTDPAPCSLQFELVLAAPATMNTLGCQHGYGEWVRERTKAVQIARDSGSKAMPSSGQRPF